MGGCFCIFFVNYSKTKVIAKRVIILLFLLNCLVKVNSQVSTQILKFDTVQLKQGYILTINNRSYISKKDTILLIPSSVRYKLSSNRSGNLFEKLDSSAQYSRLARELRNMILVKHNSSIKRETGETVKSESNFIQYQNKIIRNISFRQLNVFGPTIDDTTRTPDSWLEKTSNKIHFNTREYLLRNNLIVHEGDLIDPLKLADNERILREATYIHDARIYVRPVNNSDSVDLYIVVKDVWPKAFDLNMLNLYSGSFAVWDKNILGFGHESRNSIFWNTKKKPGFGYEGIYSIPNIGGSFIRGRGTYMNKFGNETYGLSFDRNFYTPGVKYAGGLSVFKTSKPDYFQYPDTTIIAPVSFLKSDFWLGRSFSLDRWNSLLNSRKSVAFAFRVSNTSVSQRPSFSENQFYIYQDRTLYLSSLTYSSQRFYKSNLIYNYGRTEDIPLGFQIQLVNGFETREFNNRGFAGFNASYANYFSKLGYFYFWVGQEGFVLNKRIEQGMITAKFNHFSALYKFNRFRFRHFVDVEFTKGIHRFKDEYLTINDSYGLKGFYNDSIRGIQRLNIHTESVCFSPWYFYEFRFVFFASAEFSIFGNNKSFWKNPVYPALSFGIRIRNERLVFNTIELRFFVYPNKPSYSETQLVRVSGEEVLVPQNFENKPPITSMFR